MSKSREGEKLKTFDELFASSFPIKTDAVFELFQQNSLNPLKPNRLDADHFSEKWRDESDIRKTAIIMHCDGLNAEIYSGTNSEIYKQFYFLPEIKHPKYETLLLGARSPFYEKLQMYFNLFFESGIRQHFAGLLELKNVNQHLAQVAFMSNEGYLFNLDDLYGIFLLLLAGKLISLAVFLIEILTPAIKKFYRRRMFVVRRC